MSLRDALSAPHRDPRIRCGTADWIKSLSEDEQEAAAKLLESDLSHMEVFMAFKTEHYPLQYNAFLRHRNGTDSCVVG